MCGGGGGGWGVFALLAFLRSVIFSFLPKIRAAPPLDPSLYSCKGSLESRNCDDLFWEDRKQKRKS